MSRKVIISLAFSVTAIAAMGGGPPAFEETISRSFTITNEALNPPTFAESISRSFSVTNEALNPPTFSESISRSFTVVNEAQDCNENGILDECDVDCGPKGGMCDVEGCGLSSDCNANGVPDECELPESCPEGICTDGCDADCNANCVIDSCDVDPADPDGDGEVSDDCNGNGTPDECDLDPLDPDGDGEVSGDCDENSIPDECDIADCPPGDASCDDCNVNEIPDGCDVDPDDPDGNGQVSLDLDGDGVPDECVEWDGDSKVDDLWSTAVNWDDDVVPGIDDPADLESVVIAGLDVNVILDVDPSIDSMFLGSDATLQVTNGDLSVLDPTDVFEGNMLVRGDLQIGDGHSISAEGEVTIGPGGVYQADPEAAGAVSALLIAGSVTVLEGPAAAGGGGVMSLTEDMVLIVEGDLTLDGSNATGGDGDCTPPDWNTGGNALATVIGDMDMEGGVESEHASSEPLMLGGDFNNHSIVPQIFNWTEGLLTMDGMLQSIEAAGEDRGPWPIGLIDNFALGALTLTAGGVVEVVDAFDNQQDGVVACDEALYVDVLEAPEGATLLTDGCRVYYNTLVGGGSVPGFGVEVLQIQDPDAADLNGDGEVGAFDLATLLASWGPCGDCENCPADLNGDCEVGAFDLAQLLASWGS